MLIPRSPVVWFATVNSIWHSVCFHVISRDKFFRWGLNLGKVRGESQPERRCGEGIIASTAFRLEFQVRYYVFVFLFLFNSHFCYAVNKTFYRRTNVRPQKISQIRCSAKFWDESQWEFSFYGIENELLLRIICHTERLKPFQITGGTGATPSDFYAHLVI